MKSQPWRWFGYWLLIIIKFCKIYLWISARIIVHLGSYIKNSTWEVFHLYPDTSKSVSKNMAVPHISAHFSVSGYRMKHCVSFFMYYMKYLSFSFLIHQLHFFQVNPNIKFEVFIHKVDGLSDDHKIGGFNLLAFGESNILL